MAELFNKNFSSKDAKHEPWILMTKEEPQIRCATCRTPLPLDNGYLTGIWCETCQGPKMYGSPSTKPITPTRFRCWFICPCGHSWHQEYDTFPGWFPNVDCPHCVERQPPTNQGE